MNILIEPHTLQRAKERGASQAEIREVLLNGRDIPGRHGRKGRFKVYVFDSVWNGRHYPEKRVEVFFVDADDTRVTVTVYVFYGQWSKI